jgi:mannose-6-phosphate isomerase-like protein (cupin superfamily)
MTGDVRELLPLYALGILDGDEARVVERAVAGDAALAAELAAYQDTADALGDAVAPVAPSPDIKARLLASVGGGRFEQFADRMAQLFEVTVERARELLGLIERPASWVTQLPGIALIHFEGGPALANADCGFLRVAPGTMFPPHVHVGEELVTVLSGQMRDMVNGHVVNPGEDYRQAAGTTHYFQATGDVELVYASRALEGIEVGGQRARPVKN